jgi:hypothetical protein
LATVTRGWNKHNVVHWAASQPILSTDLKLSHDTHYFCEVESWSTVDLSSSLNLRAGFCPICHKIQFCQALQTCPGGQMLTDAPSTTCKPVARHDLSTRGDHCAGADFIFPFKLSGRPNQINWKPHCPRSPFAALCTTFVFLQWCASEAASCPRHQTLNEDINFGLHLTAPLKKHFVVHSGASTVTWFTTCLKSSVIFRWRVRVHC